MRCVVYGKLLVACAALALTSFPIELAAQPQPGTPRGPVLRFTDVHRRAECFAQLPRIRRLCTLEAFSGQNYVQMLIADFDEDGRADVAIRYLQRHRCSGGSHGCQTEIYRGTPRGFVNIHLNAVTAGQVRRCRRNARPGVRFGIPVPNRHCFLIR